MFGKKGKDTEEKSHIAIHVNFKIILLCMIVLLAGCTVLGARWGINWQQNKSELVSEKEEVTSDILEQQLQQIGELSTVKYLYTNMAKYENTKQLLDYDIPLTTKSFTISYDGTIKAGVNLEKVTFNIQNNVITITIPQSTILSNDVDMDSVTVYDEKSSIFNGLATDDVTNFLAEQEDSMESKAIDGGILEEANSNAISTLTTMFSTFLSSGNFEESYKLNVVTEEE